MSAREPRAGGGAPSLTAVARPARSIPMKIPIPRSAALRLSLVLVLASFASSCRGLQIHQLERRVDQLESRVANLEGRLAANPK